MHSLKGKALACAACLWACATAIAVAAPTPAEQAPKIDGEAKLLPRDGLVLYQEAGVGKREVQFLVRKSGATNIFAAGKPQLYLTRRQIRKIRSHQRVIDRFYGNARSGGRFESHTNRDHLVRWWRDPSIRRTRAVSLTARFGCPFDSDRINRERCPSYPRVPPPAAPRRMVNHLAALYRNTLARARRINRLHERRKQRQRARNKGRAPR